MEYEPKEVGRCQFMKYRYTKLWNLRVTTKLWRATERFQSVE